VSGPIVGIVGAGQLARMTAQAAIPLDVRLRLLAADPADSAAQVCPDVTVGTPAEALVDFAATCDVVTFDHELVDPVALATALGDGRVLRPSPAALRFAQDKDYQRAAFAAAGLPVPAHAMVVDAEAAAQFAVGVGWPIVLKSPRGGYDGRGVAVVERSEDLDAVWARMGDAPLLVEERVPIVAEFAVLVVRRPSGHSAVYPVVQTVQSDGICTEMLVPAGVPPDVVREAEEVGRTVADIVEAVGVLAVELFWDGDRILVNEVATRPHNSGHWTIEGAVTSQFANHLRGVLDWPLGDTARTAAAVATVNLLGPPDGSDPRARRADALAVPGAAVHLYGKAARAGRKLGHVTAVGDDPLETLARARRCVQLLEGGSFDD
jgi:5-(carboxyamino)imidazole ribonucleotide synthase